MCISSLSSLLPFHHLHPQRAPCWRWKHKEGIMCFQFDWSIKIEGKGESLKSPIGFRWDLKRYNDRTRIHKVLKSNYRTSESLRLAEHLSHRVLECSVRWLLIWRNARKSRPKDDWKSSMHLPSESFPPINKHQFDLLPIVWATLRSWWTWWQISRLSSHITSLLSMTVWILKTPAAALARFYCSWIATQLLVWFDRRFRCKHFHVAESETTWAYLK